jgi:hypothetical protein
MDWSEILEEAAAPAGLASLATTLALALLSKNDTGSPVAAINSVSHMPFGDEAFDHDEASPKYTITGALLNAAAVSGWALLHEMAVNKTDVKKSPWPLVITSGLISAAAYATDYHVVPKRLTPGFEEKLQPKSMFAVYAILAGAIAVGTFFRGKKKPPKVNPAEAISMR